MTTVKEVDLPEEVREEASTFGIAVDVHEGYFNLDEVKFMVYGESGAGKTVFASTWPDAIFLDIDRGMSSVTRAVSKVTVNNWNDLEGAFQFLSRSNHHFKTVIVDSLNELQYMCMRHIISKFPNIRRAYEDLASQSDYGKMLDEAEKYIRNIRSLRMNVVFICNVAPREYETDPVQPHLVGKHSPRNVARMMDTIGYLYKVEGAEGGEKKDRVIVFDAVNYVTKDRSGLLPNQVKNPTHGKIYEYWTQQFENN